MDFEWIVWSQIRKTCTNGKDPELSEQNDTELN